MPTIQILSWNIDEHSFFNRKKGQEPHHISQAFPEKEILGHYRQNLFSPPTPSDHLNLELELTISLNP